MEIIKYLFYAKENIQKKNTQTSTAFELNCFTRNLLDTIILKFVGNLLVRLPGIQNSNRTHVFRIVG